MDKGAHFFRCDFQVHTPRDPAWKGPDATSTKEREAYGVSLIQACREKGIDAIAITDHHDLIFVPYLRKAAETETDAKGKLLSPEKRIVVFPGMELTLELSLNPQYNCFIGGRGTGKSTILEYIRWALCDQPPRISDDETPNYQARRTRLIEQTLQPFKANIEVAFSLNDVDHLVRRTSADGTLLIKVGTDEMRPCTEAEVRALLPIQAYSQKQLSDVSIRIDELMRFVTTPIQIQLNQINRRISERIARLRESHASRQRYETLARDLKKRELEIQSLQKQADQIRKSLTGLTDADRKLLDRGKGYDAAEQAVAGWQEHISTLLENASGLKQQVDQQFKEADQPPSEPDFEFLKDMYDDYKAVMKESFEKLALITRKAAAFHKKEDDPKSHWSKWRDQLTDFREAQELLMSPTFGMQ